MSTTKFSATQATARLQNISSQIWHAVSSPKLLWILLPLILVVLGISLILPQQPGPEFGPAISAETIWLNSLPTWLASMGRVLYLLGFARILASFWLWVPLALLLGHSLIALARFGPGSWRRFYEAAGDLAWQHPLADRVEHLVRLSDAPDDQLVVKSDILTKAGFVLHENKESDERFITALRRRWAWLGPIFGYSGLVLLIAAFFVSNIWLQRDRLSLTTGQRVPYGLTDGFFELIEANPIQQTGRVSHRPTRTEALAQTLTWRVYRPSWWGSTLVIPTHLDTLLVVTAQNEQGEPLEIAPLQGADPTQRLRLPLTLDSPILFSISNTDLAFQVLPAAEGSSFNVQVRQGAESLLIMDESVPAGQIPPVEGLTITLSRDYTMQVMLWRDPALLLYGLSLIFMGLAVVTFLRPPMQIWLIPEVKGRGGQLYGVSEGYASADQLRQFLDQLLGPSDEVDKEKASAL